MKTFRVMTDRAVPPSYDDVVAEQFHIEHGALIFWADGGIHHAYAPGSWCSVGETLS